MNQDVLTPTAVASRMEPAVSSLREVTAPFADEAPDPLLELAALVARLAGDVQVALAAGDEARATLRSLRAQALYMARVADAAVADAGGGE